MRINLMFINTLSSSQPQSYFVQPQTSTSALDVDTLSCFGSSSSEEEEVSDTSSTSSSSVDKQESFYKVYLKWMSILIDMFIYYRCMLISKHMPRDLGTVFILYTVYWLLYLKQRAICKVWAWASPLFVIGRLRYHCNRCVYIRVQHTCLDVKHRWYIHMKNMIAAITYNRMKKALFLVMWVKILPSIVEVTAAEHTDDIDIDDGIDDDNDSSVKWIILVIYFIVLPAMVVVMVKTRR